ncbi:MULTISPECIES: hypothetical protein [unclassified Dyella]|jgi:hypothetical protein|uniref:hypothetical protein n=1 Tax=Dyella sp. ASV21 TaxID=2795114 RepID=UPI0018EAF4CA|nr:MULTISPECIES: hypothetical protein [unclassified Dyella]
MSTHIEYKHLALSLNMAALQNLNDCSVPPAIKDQLLLVLCESGDSNCTTLQRGSDGRTREVRSRSWGLRAFGSEDDIIEHIAKASADAEGMMIAIGNMGSSGCVSAESYIRKYRRTLQRPVGHYDALVPLMHSLLTLYGAEEAIAGSEYFSALKREGALTACAYGGYSIRLTPQDDECVSILRHLAMAYQLWKDNPKIWVGFEGLGYLDHFLSKYFRRAA